jgi:hypothetical protein
MRTEELVNKAMIASKVDFKRLPREELEMMAEAGHDVLEVHRILAKTGDNIVGELLRNNGTFYEWDHYPPGDVYDRETHSQYYYHAHPFEDRLDREHGHFHTFLRPKGMPSGLKPVKIPGMTLPKDPNDHLSHLVAVTMDSGGLPFGLFTTNRWVTGEVWYKADDVIAMLDAFEIDHAQPSWPVNRWIGALLRLYRPQIRELVRARDRFVEGWSESSLNDKVFEDRNLEITSMMRINLQDQLRDVGEALGQ